MRRVASTPSISGIETSINDDIRPEHVRLSDRLESIGGFAHDLKLRPRLQ